MKLRSGRKPTIASHPLAPTTPPVADRAAWRAPLTALPACVVECGLLALLEEKDLLALRSTCRELKAAVVRWRGGGRGRHWGGMGGARRGCASGPAERAGRAPGPAMALRPAAGARSSGAPT